ncbi:KRAB-A domain-containing protein 2-like [Pieris napi]|uniref:KRAB-A domain-containing protein 2-like n=1 Tax=Pieris napi TaxID=78633 RepID=UPI001FBA2A68|nr:KRAB-A domain-containing protein 2-like [Pieris napi]
MATEQSARSFRERFDTKFQELFSAKGLNSFYFSNEQYLEIINSVKSAKEAKSKTTLQYRRLKRFDLCSVSGVEKLIAPLSSSETTIKYYVTNDEMFDILHETHLAVGHGGKHRMEKECKKKYKNITQEVIKLYLRLCEPCQKKLKSAKKGIVVKPLVSTEMNSRCQVDLIDMQSNPDGDFKFIMVYQDHLTKFVQLRALTSKRAVEVAYKLLDIFCIFGAPSILQSDNGREFANHVIEELCSMWSGLKIVHGKPRHSQSQGSVERANQDVQNMLMTWMNDENCKRWSEGLKFVQLMKNRAFHDGIKRAPYTAMFGSDVKVGLASSSLPKEVIVNIHTEEELEKMLTEFTTEAESSPESQEEGPESRQESQEDLLNVELESENYHLQNTEMRSDIETEVLNTKEGERNVLLEINSEETAKKKDELECSRCMNPGTSTQEINLCEICTTQQNINKHRLSARLSLENQAKKMKALSNLKFPPCSVGDTVRVQIPDVDRGRGEFRNVLMVVIEKAGDLYRLGNERGTIEEMFSRNQFSVCHDKLIDIENISPEKKSLRELANEQSLSGGQGYKRCNCKTKCATKKCSCKAAGKLCNSKCHSSLSCSNK